MTNLVIVLPSGTSDEFPYDFETAEAMYGSLLERSFTRLTLIDIEGGFSAGGIPKGMEDLLKEVGMEDLYNNCEVVDIQSMDPLMKDWGTLICSYFQPMLPSGVAGIDASYLVGPGTALLTGLMVGLATSNGSTILANAPRDEHELTTAIEMDFVRRGLTSYSELFGGAIIGKAPNKASAFQRNILVRLYEEGAFHRTYANPDGRWMSARQLASDGGMPESAQGVGGPADVLVKMGLVQQHGGETDLGRVAMTYALTASGVVAALETKSHHRSCFNSKFDPMERKNEVRSQSRPPSPMRAKGVIVGFRITEEDSEVSIEDSEKQANRILNSFEYVCPVICHIGPECQTRFMPLDQPERWQKNIHETVIKQRNKGMSDEILYSICGPDWNPELHFCSVVDALRRLPPNVDWVTDITRLISLDQIIFSIASNLMDIPMIYTARDRGKGSRGGKAKAPEGAVISQDTLRVNLPKADTWRLIRDLHDESVIPERMSKLPIVLSSIPKPSTEYEITKEEFNSLTGSKDKQISRVEAKLDVPRTFVAVAHNSGGGNRKIAWQLTESGVVASEFLKAKGDY